MISKSIKIALSILFFLCLLRMQYGYYEFVRFSALVGFVFLAYQANQTGCNKSIFIYGTLALLVYFGETDHPIPWQTDHLNCWRKDAANAVEAFTNIVI